MEWPPPARTASTVPDWKWVRVQSLRGGGAMKITTVGVDLAKSVFTVYGVDEHGKPALRKTVRRGKLLELFAQLPACVVGMEACSGAQHWARELRELGHTPRIMAAEFVEPYRRGGKNDTNDAAAICEAVAPAADALRADQIGGAASGIGGAPFATRLGRGAHRARQSHSRPAD